MAPLHYGPAWANLNHHHWVEGWLVVADSGNGDGEDWVWERYFLTSMRSRMRIESAQWLGRVSTHL